MEHTAQIICRYRIAIFYVYADEDTIRERVKTREERTGRGVPEEEPVAFFLSFFSANSPSAPIVWHGN
jgi:hypothetical protein